LISNAAASTMSPNWSRAEVVSHGSRSPSAPSRSNLCQRAKDDGQTTKPDVDLGDRNVINVSVDSKTHRGFARSPMAKPKSLAGLPLEHLHLVDSTGYSMNTPTESGNLRPRQSLIESVRAYLWDGHLICVSV